MRFSDYFRDKITRLRRTVEMEGSLGQGTLRVIIEHTHVNGQTDRMTFPAVQCSTHAETYFAVLEEHREELIVDRAQRFTLPGRKYLQLGIEGELVAEDHQYMIELDVQGASQARLRRDYI